MANRSKGLDLVDRWTEACIIVQEAVTKTIPNKEKYNLKKVVFEEALQIAEKIRKMKGKVEREKYTQLNAKFQKIARRDKKAFLSEHC